GSKRVRGGGAARGPPPSFRGGGGGQSVEHGGARAMTGELEGRTAIVTGASRGIGKAPALGPAARAAAIVCAARTVTSDPGGLPGPIHATAATIERAGGRALAVRCDVGRAEGVRTLIERGGGGVG